MKTILILVVFAITSSSSAFAQRPTPPPDSPGPTSPSSQPVRPIPPIVEPFDPDKPNQKSGITIEQLPPVTQEEVFTSLADIFGPPAMANQTGGARMGSGSSKGSGKYKAKQQQDRTQQLETARVDYERITRREKPLPKLLLWTLKVDAYFIRNAAHLDERYATAGFEHLHKVAASADAHEEAKVTIATLNSLGKPAGGFQICFTPAEWADLPSAPQFAFPYPSDSSESLPKAVYMFWSRAFADESKVGPRTTRNIDKDQNLSIGTPSP